MCIIVLNLIFTTGLAKIYPVATIRICLEFAKMGQNTDKNKLQLNLSITFWHGAHAHDHKLLWTVALFKALLLGGHTLQVVCVVVFQVSWWQPSCHGGMGSFFCGHCWRCRFYRTFLLVLWTLFYSCIWHVCALYLLYVCVFFLSVHMSKGA